MLTGGSHPWVQEAKVPTPIPPHCSPLGAQARLKGHLSVPRASPLASPALGPAEKGPAGQFLARVGSVLQENSH